MTALIRLRRIIRKQLISPIQEFIKDSRAVGVTLLVCTIASLLLANGDYSEKYLSIIGREVHLVNGIHLPHTLLHWINDGLMALFFFLVGMEIKRELVIGELSSVKKASLPIAAALGGMIVPALIFLFFNGQTPYHSGWGIPMATDIAFSLGVASLLGSRVPVSLKIFLMALAIIDDLGAIVVIAVFYGGTISWLYLLAGAVMVLVLYLFTRFGWQRWGITLAGGLLLWYCIFNSGIHATIAGVVVAFLVPLEKLGHYEHTLHDFVNFIILPLFAIANTAIVIPDNFADALMTPLSWGIIGGLVIGKPVGITLFSWLTIRSGLSEPPTGTRWIHLAGIGALAGIGFTMSIFITMLAFAETSVQDVSKISILIAALFSIAFGLMLLAFPPKN